MLKYNRPPTKVVNYLGKDIYVFNSESDISIDQKTIKSFGLEWTRFNSFSNQEIQKAGDQYFDIVCSHHVNKDSLVLDVGCGTGRWSKYLSDKVKFIEAIDPSDAVYSAVRLTKDIQNIRITRASIDTMPFDDNLFDFIICLGVLHHVSDIQRAINEIVKKLKSGGYLLVYIYYNLDNKGWFLRSLFFLSNNARKVIFRLPDKIKVLICDLLAVVVYLPLVTFSRALKKAFPHKNFYSKVPLSYYWDKSFHMIRNDSLDRFGTPLEKRYSRAEIKEIMEKAGLKEIVFSEKEPYWHAIGVKK